MIVKKKKTIKHLMAIGIQRNDAAVFAKVYQKVKNAGRQDLFPSILEPVTPVVGTVVNYCVTSLRASAIVRDYEMAIFSTNKEELMSRIKAGLKNRLVESLFDSGAVETHAEQIERVGTQYTATVKVVMPGV